MKETVFTVMKVSLILSLLIFTVVTGWRIYTQQSEIAEREARQSESASARADAGLAPMPVEQKLAYYPQCDGVDIYCDESKHPRICQAKVDTNPMSLEITRTIRSGWAQCRRN